MEMSVSDAASIHRYVQICHQIDKSLKICLLLSFIEVDIQFIATLPFGNVIYMGHCIYIETLSNRFLKLVPRKNSQSFIVIDIENNTVFSSRKGFYTCSDFESAKNLVRILLLDKKVDANMLYIVANLDEKALEKAIPILSKNPNEQNPNEIAIIGRVIYTLPCKKKTLFMSKRIDAKIILEIVEFIASYMK